MDSIIALFENFDIAAFVPELDTIMGKLELVVRIAVMIGPLVLLGLGLWYFLAPPKEANHRAGFRTFWGMGSVEAWQFTQRLAGICFGVLGLILTVVMALICNGYRGMDAMEMIWSAGKCVVVQIGLVLLTTIAIHIVVLILYDWKGDCRSEKRKRAKAQKEAEEAENAEEE